MNENFSRRAARSTWPLLLFWLSFLNSAPLTAASITVADLQLFIHSDSGLIQLDAFSPQYSATSGPGGLTSFGWTYQNDILAEVLNLQILVFLDADTDRDLNTFFNEYGDFQSLTLPGDAPAGAIAASSWQIDEPGFVFGTIQQDLLAGTLTNTNTVPSSAPDDVSLALGFQLASLAPGQSFVIRLSITDDLHSGLAQFDPDSLSAFGLSGYLLLNPLSSPPPSGVPEPATFILFASAAAVALFLRR